MTEVMSSDQKEPQHFARSTWLIMSKPLAATVMAYLTAVAIGAGVAGISPLAAIDKSANTGPSAFEIFVNNAAVLPWIWLGLVSLGLVSLAVICLNGALLGWVVGKSIVDGNSVDIVTGILPHFVPEMGAFFLSAAITIALAVRLPELFKSGRSRSKWPGYLRIWLVVQLLAVVLVAIGAIVERTVSYV